MDEIESSKALLRVVYRSLNKMQSTPPEIFNVGPIPDAGTLKSMRYIKNLSIDEAATLCGLPGNQWRRFEDGSAKMSFAEWFTFKVRSDYV